MTGNGIVRFECVAPHVQLYNQLCMMYDWLRWLWYPWMLLMLPRSWDQIFYISWPCIFAYTRCLPSPTSRCNFYLLDICLFSLKYVCSLKVAGSKVVYSRFPERCWTPIPCLIPFLTSPMHQFFAPSPPTPPACPWSHPTHDWLPKLAGETLTHTLSTIFA